MLRILSLLFLLISITSTSYANLLQSGFTVEYDVNYNGMELGVSKRSLLFLSDQKAIYKAETVPEGFASLIIQETIKEISNIKITRDNITPSQYVITKNKRGKIDKVTIDFDWKEKTVTNSYLKKTEPLKENTHDLLSLQLNIMQDLQRNKKSMLYQVATKKHNRSYNLKVEKEELLETPMGEYKTIKLTASSPEGKSQFIFWCAKDFEFLPIKIQKINDRGDKVSFILRSFAVQK